MTKKSLLFVGVLAIFSLPILSAKSYGIGIASPTVVGNAQLPKGQYSLKVEGTNAVFTNLSSHKTFTTPVKIENGDAKYEVTMVETATQDGTQHIVDIQLGGSKTKLEFD